MRGMGDGGVRRRLSRGGCEDCQNLPKERYAMEKTTTVVPFR